VCQLLESDPEVGRTGRPGVLGTEEALERVLALFPPHYLQDQDGGAETPL
jgi:hypothetical protein